MYELQTEINIANYIHDDDPDKKLPAKLDEDELARKFLAKQDKSVRSSIAETLTVPSFSQNTVKFEETTNGSVVADKQAMRHQVQVKLMHRRTSIDTDNSLGGRASELNPETKTASIGFSVEPVCSFFDQLNQEDMANSPDRDGSKKKRGVISSVEYDKSKF